MFDIVAFCRFVLAVGAASVSLTGAGMAHASGYTVLHSFIGGATDGAYPEAKVIVDQGSLYGTTGAGGGAGCSGGGCGTVFSIARNGSERLLFSFPYPRTDGANPSGHLTNEKTGSFYGTAPDRGKYGYGTVYRLTIQGKQSVLYDFKGGSDGAYPVANVIQDSAGNLYGMTENGGVFNANCDYQGCGVVFKITAKGVQKVLYAFKGGNHDGGNPAAGLTIDAAGNLYGTTSSEGKAGAGVVFKVTPGGSESVLYAFTGGRDGGYPLSHLIMDASGNLYGTTTSGGDKTCRCGVVFEIGPDGAEKVLLTFDLANGASPTAGLVMDGAGNLFGTTTNGGAGQGDCCGVVFELTAGGTEKVLHEFLGGADGQDPVAGLTMDNKGHLFGTTYVGGAAESGTVFELDK